MTSKNKNKQKTVQTRRLQTSAIPDMSLSDDDAPGNVKVEQQLETVPKDVGEKESEMDGSQILSDGGVTDEDQVAMDEAEQGDEEADEKRVCGFLCFVLFFCLTNKKTKDLWRVKILFFSWV